MKRSLLLVFLLLESERERVDAIALPGRLRTIIENVAKMAPTTLADYLDSSRAQRIIRSFFYLVAS